MKKDNKLTGNRGEDLAVEFLHNKGFLIVERNFRTRYGEIDIVCYDKNILVFVEVKTKIGHDFGEPEEMINKKKLGQVERMGEVFIEMNNFSLSGSNQNRHCESRTRAAAIPATIDFAQSSEIASVQRSETRNDDLRKWSGGCRVDVVAVVLDRDLELESIKHYEAVY